MVHCFLAVFDKDAVLENGNYLHLRKSDKPLRKIKINDEYILRNSRFFAEKTAEFESVWNDAETPCHKGLFYYGETLICSENRRKFLEAVKKTKNLTGHDDKEKLIKLCGLSLKKGAVIIHIGI